MGNKIIGTKDIGDIERDQLTRHGKRIGIHEMLKQNERKSMKLKTEV